MGPDRQSDRLKRNADSLGKAEHHREPWSIDELDWLQAWEPGDEALLAEIAEVLGRTIEACREQFYKRRRSGWSLTVTETRTTNSDGSTTTSRTTAYRGWTEADGDGW